MTLGHPHTHTRGKLLGPWCSAQSDQPVVHVPGGSCLRRRHLQTGRGRGTLVCDGFGQRFFYLPALNASLRLHLPPVLPLPPLCLCSLSLCSLSLCLCSLLLLLLVSGPLSNCSSLSSSLSSSSSSSLPSVVSSSSSSSSPLHTIVCIEPCSTCFQVSLLLRSRLQQSSSGTLVSPISVTPPNMNRELPLMSREGLMRGQGSVSAAK
mmetsp:Transcript_8955/g.19722  ORF Transcript_8955/g.19722 Transcript_8955/m.19722 type:complete len:207 (-) Transcript_8955:383-1003(-)